MAVNDRLSRVWQNYRLSSKAEEKTEYVLAIEGLNESGYFSSSFQITKQCIFDLSQRVPVIYIIQLLTSGPKFNTCDESWKHISCFTSLLWPGTFMFLRGELGAQAIVFLSANLWFRCTLGSVTSWQNHWFNTGNKYSKLKTFKKFN